MPTNKKRSPRAPAPVQPCYVGVARGEDVEMPGVVLKKIEYKKRDREECAKLRQKFDSAERKAFLQGIANDPEKRKQLKRAGLTENDIAAMKDGEVPDGWQVHHKLPLDDGGTNDTSNLVLIKQDPHHIAMSNARTQLAKGLEPGKSRIVKFPVPPGFVYPPIASKPRR